MQRSLVLGLAASVASTCVLVVGTTWAGEPSRVSRGESSTIVGGLERTGRAYAEAKKNLARGKPAAALLSLRKVDGDLLLDRALLVKADSLLALGQVTAAQALYLEAKDAAQNDAVRRRALLGLATTYDQLRNRERQLESLDELLKIEEPSRMSATMLERASTLVKLGRHTDAAQAAWSVVERDSSGRAGVRAQALIELLGKKGVKIPVSRDALALLGIRAFVRAREFSRAEEAILALVERAPKLVVEATLLRAEICKLQRRREEEIAILKTLLADSVLDDQTAREVLDRLGRAALAVDDLALAAQSFEALSTRFPDDARAVEGEFLAAWGHYNKREYGVATERFLALVERHKTWSRRPEAIWFCGWSAFLGADLAVARRAFLGLLEEHPQSELALWAHYWLGRIKEQQGDTTAAKASYRDVLRIAPLSYQSGFAIERLERLGEEVVIVAPESKERATLSQVLVALGDKRPRGVDRGVALFKAGVEDEALEEIDASFVALKKTRDTKTRVMIAEMLEALGAHHQAYRLASDLIKDGADLIAGAPYAWRAWRLAYPKAFDAEVNRAALAHGVDPLLVLAVMRSESSFRPNAKSPVGARGLMQIMPDTAKRIGRAAKGGRVHAARYVEPASNIWLGSWYLKSLLDRYGGQAALAVGAYNASPAAMDRWINDPRHRELDGFVEGLSYRETRIYIRRVLEAYQIYRLLERAPRADLALVVPTPESLAQAGESF